MLCKCCSADVKGIICDRCGYDNAVYLQGDNDVETYKNNIVDSMIDFQTRIYVWEWNEAQREMKVNESTQKLMKTAKDCYKKIWWSEPLFSSSVFEEKRERVITIEYTMNGKKYSDSLRITPLLNKGYEQLGFLIDEEFCLTAFQGRPESYAQSQKVKLKIL